MDIDKKLELLKKIQKVDAPPFMLTRIKERIDAVSNSYAPATWRVAFVVVSVIILSLNVSILFMPSGTPAKQGIEEVVNSMELSTTNTLYHE